LVLERNIAQSGFQSKLPPLPFVFCSVGLCWRYSITMCNRVVQNEVVIKPGERATVLLKGPGGEFDLPFTDAIFGGPAKRESRNYWIKREGAEGVIVPNVSRFGEKNKTTGAQCWEDVPPGSALEGLLLPRPPGKYYRLLKIVTQPATPDQLARLGNDRAPVVREPKG
jgi:hypothetical protein